jgi:hypothetical protein
LCGALCATTLKKSFRARHKLKTTGEANVKNNERQTNQKSKKALFEKKKKF